MAKTIVQKVVFKNTTPKKLYDLYSDAKLHSVISGSPVIFSKKKGGKFSSHNGYITGTNLLLVENKFIVQTWRGMDWDPGDSDSIFTIYLETKKKDTVLHAIHSNVPDKAEAGISKGWYDHYWNPWKQFLAGKPIKRPTM